MFVIIFFNFFFFFVNYRNFCKHSRPLMKEIILQKSNFWCRENIYICRPLRRLRRIAVEYVKKWRHDREFSITLRLQFPYQYNSLFVPIMLWYLRWKNDNSDVVNISEQSTLQYYPSLNYMQWNLFWEATLTRGHTPLERPLDNVNLNINVLISTPDERPPLLKVHFSDAKGVASLEGFHCL